MDVLATPQPAPTTPEIEVLREDSDFAETWDMGPPSAPPDLREKSREEVVALMVEWFFDNFEDPVENTPWDGETGGYVYIWGGPYDASIELEGAFGDAATEQALEEAIAEIEGKGWEWAPSDRRMQPEEPWSDVVSAKRRLMGTLQNWEETRGVGFKEAKASFYISDVALLLREHHRLQQCVNK
jgi:hypothetical protein